MHTRLFKEELQHIVMRYEEYRAALLRHIARKRALLGQGMTNRAIE